MFPSSKDVTFLGRVFRLVRPVISAICQLLRSKVIPKLSPLNVARRLNVLPSAPPHPSPFVCSWAAGEEEQARCGDGRHPRLGPRSRREESHQVSGDGDDCGSGRVLFSFFFFRLPKWLRQWPLNQGQFFNQPQI